MRIRSRIDALAPLRADQASKKGLPKQEKRSDVHAKGMNIALSRPGGHGGVAAPVPIPNTAVKRPSANGTSS